MESTAQEIAGFKKKMKRSNDYNPTIDRLSIEQKKIQNADWADKRSWKSQRTKKQEKSNHKENKKGD